ncbi:hypothetical protein EYF80_050805 [Liparis tanakae]|uniref:Uncharacterized protein n=1 Tax=Liparis tanakae TaxID=230148 RepID=A0A4Z2FDP5_9TELE|nr:hypothetical protein EYF80_050805 [Liparis tanakae]
MLKYSDDITPVSCHHKDPIAPSAQLHTSLRGAGRHTPRTGLSTQGSSMGVKVYIASSSGSTSLPVKPEQS